MSDDKIKKIPVKFRKKQPDKMLHLVPSYQGCREHHYLIDAESDRVTCRNCDKIFNPMSVLVDLARKESRWMMNFDDYQDRMKRLDEKKRVKCRHCDKFTPVKDR